jgi:hypothetical protein
VITSRSVFAVEIWPLEVVPFVFAFCVMVVPGSS